MPNNRTDGAPPPTVRAFTRADLAAAATVAAAAFELDLRAPSARARWRARVAHGLRADPRGAFVAYAGDRLVGVAQAMARERLWCLSLLTVAPGTQSAGAGRALLERALGYASELADGLIVSSSDPRALRLYARAGFALRPALAARGIPDRRALRAGARALREGGVRDLAALEAISREVRGGPHTAELRFALERGATLHVIDERGFAVTDPERGPWLLAARDEEAASALLHRALARTPRGAAVRVGWITAEQRWAVEVALRAGLELVPHGALCVRGEPGTRRPFLPSAPFA